MTTETPSTAKSLRPYRFTRKNLYNLMPSIYRARDAELGKPLEALLGVISEQVRVVEDNIGDLYDDWFIETCDPWVVPYIGDLLEARLLNENVTGGTLPERAYVANTISYRRRKGTVSMLEELSADVTGWPAKVVEFFELLETTQYLNHLRPFNLRTPDIRNENTLELLDTPFDSIAHTVDVRHINNGRGYYNIPSVGIFLYRLTAYPVNNSPASVVQVTQGGTSFNAFRFNVLGLDEPLFNNPVEKTSDLQLAREINVPLPIRRTALFDDASDYYTGGGSSKSITIVADDVTVGVGSITAYDLSGWWRPPEGSGLVAVDPLLGRITFAEGWNPTNVQVSYYYGFSDEVGGGFYQRPDPDSSQVTVLSGGSTQPGHVYGIKQVGATGPFQFNTITDALSKWASVDGSPAAIFEIQDSEVYVESPLYLSLPAGTNVEIRAAQEQRPILQMPILVNAAQAVQGAEQASLFLNGLVLDVAPATTSLPAIWVQPGDLGALTVRNCTLRPSSGTSLSVSGLGNGTTTNDDLVVTVDHSITGGLSIDPSVSEAQLQVEDSIIDGQSGSVAPGSLTIAVPGLLNDHPTVGEAIAMTLTTTTAALVKGQTSIPVVSTTGFAAGAQITINPGGTDQEPGVIGSIPSVNSLTLASPLVNNHSALGEAIAMTLTTTTAALVKGQTSIPVVTVAGFQSSASITINPGGTDRESVTVSSAQGGTPGVALNCYQLTIEESTVFGQTLTFMVSLASNTIFTQPILSTRRQVGCVRFCYLPAGSRVPRPYKCQPSYPPGATYAEQVALELGVKPVFTSVSYGDPGYAQLSIDGPAAIFRGADNGAEMGVFNELLQALRIDNLNACLPQYLRFGLEAGILLAT